MKIKDRIIKYSISLVFILLPLIDIIRVTDLKDIEIFNLSLIEFVNIFLISIGFITTIIKNKFKHMFLSSNIFENIPCCNLSMLMSSSSSSPSSSVYLLIFAWHFSIAEFFAEISCIMFCFLFIYGVIIISAILSRWCFNICMFHSSSEVIIANGRSVFKMLSILFSIL